MLPADLEREIEAAAAIRNLQARVRRLETLEQEGCFQLIESQTGATFTTITIPDIYKHLYVVYSAGAASSPVGDSIGLRFNGDAGANYNWIRRLWTLVAEATFSDAGGSTFANIGLEGTDSEVPAAGYALIPDYLSTTKNKTYVAQSFTIAFAPTSYHLAKFGGRWINNAAITSIDIPGTYYSNSMFSVYGLC